LDVRLGGASLAGAVLALLVGFSAFGFGGTEPAMRGGDHVSAAQAAAMAAAYSRATGSLLPVELSTEAQREELIRSLHLPRADAERVIAQAQNGDRALGWLTLWDNFDEDGDVVAVSAAGVTQTVELRHAPTRILVPYIPGQPVYLTGEKDGMGGGVTVAVELSTGPLPLPPLAVGQTVALPLL
jgi:hypothetical protein